MVAVVVGVALVTGGAGWMIGTQITSPADAAAQHQPPTPSLITVPVARRTLTSTVVAQGTVTYAGSNPLTLVGLVGGDSTQLVTKAPLVGTRVRSGDVLMEVSGRPVFVLAGVVPMYRTLVAGDRGDDVKQLQKALSALGYGHLTSGVFDDATATKVTHWYEHAGYEPQQTTDQPPTVSIPSGEILFLPKLPVRLDTVTTRAGAQATGQIGTTTDLSAIVQATLPSSDAALVHTGLHATLSLPDGTTKPATVAAMGAAAAPPATTDPAGSDASDAPAPPQDGTTSDTPLRLTVPDATALGSYAGQAVQITIEVGSTKGAALVVPVAAVVTGADGQARVQVQRASGQVQDVPVKLGLTAQGLVAVTPVSGTLAAGDRVVVGTS